MAIHKVLGVGMRRFGYPLAGLLCTWIAFESPNVAAAERSTGKLSREEIIRYANDVPRIWKLEKGSRIFEHGNPGMYDPWHYYQCIGQQGEHYFYAVTLNLEIAASGQSLAVRDGALDFRAVRARAEVTPNGIGVWVFPEPNNIASQTRSYIEKATFIQKSIQYQAWKYDGLSAIIRSPQAGIELNCFLYEHKDFLLQYFRLSCNVLKMPHCDISKQAQNMIFTR